ncbi:deaminase domain-containing protein [Paenibacillus sp. MMO-177]|uniref:deaminase domain-containing protein n=1 Tax=Paenibacillus sp. MMO-177 TaxID=3081289 RepID=UPI003016AF5F
MIGKDLKGKVNATYLNWERSTGRKIDGGNLAMVAFEIDGHVGTFGAHSRINDSDPWLKIPEKNPSFSSLTVNLFREMGTGSYKGSSTRMHDSEMRLLDKLHKYIIRYGIKEKPGRVNLYTRLEPCLSCDNVIIQFLIQHPELSIYIYYDNDYPETPKKHMK